MMERPDNEYWDGVQGEIHDYVEALEARLASALKVVEAARAWVDAFRAEIDDVLIEDALIDAVDAWEAVAGDGAT